MAVPLSDFAESLTIEAALEVLAVAKKLEAAGKDVVMLQVGDSPFSTTAHAKQGGIQAIRDGQTHYCPSLGLPEFREAVATHLNDEYGLDLTADNVVIGPGAKLFELYFCEAFVSPGDEVLIFTPHFPTYVPNVLRRQGRVVFSPLKQENDFRPSLPDVEAFVHDHPQARAIFLNSPHNPTGGVAAPQDIRGIADLIRGKDIALFSDEPYDRMVWRGRHYSPLAQPDLLDQCVAAYTLSKSYSMSGWRIGYAVSSPRIVNAIGRMINTTITCVAPSAQLAACQALKRDAPERDESMERFSKKVELLTEALREVDGVTVAAPAGTFYVFPNVAPICNRLGIRSHGLAMYLLEGADEGFGVGCLGGECFGEAGGGFLRFSCAEPDERLHKAIDFLPEAFARTDRVARYLSAHPEYRLAEPYPPPG